MSCQDWTQAHGLKLQYGLDKFLGMTLQTLDLCEEIFEQKADLLLLLHKSKDPTRHELSRVRCDDFCQVERKLRTVSYDLSFPFYAAASDLHQ